VLVLARIVHGSLAAGLSGDNPWTRTEQRENGRRRGNRIK
jgi:hypothetical protein